MSNARTFPGVACEPWSGSSSRTVPPSNPGARLTPSGTTTQDCTGSSGVEHKPSSINQSLPPTSTPRLLERVRDVHYAAEVARTVAGIAGAQHQAELLSRFQCCVQALGAERGVFATYVRDGDKVTACRFLLACEPSWCQEYFQALTTSGDPWLAYAARHTEPIVTTQRQPTGAMAHAVTRLGARHGFASTVLVPVHPAGSPAQLSLLYLGSATAGYFEGEGFVQLRLGARALAAELHDWCDGQRRRALAAQAKFSQADLTLLRLHQQGLSTKRMAAVLGTSLSAINSRFQRMFARQGVLNRRMAAEAALACGLL